MSRTDDFAEYVLGLMQGLGPVNSKRMFGGHGFFLDGHMFALVVHNILYLKAENESKQMFLSRGLQPFTYRRKGREISISYYEAPEEILEDEEKMKKWTMLAFNVSLRS